jgi:hypothetical protein
MKTQTTNLVFVKLLELTERRITDFVVRENELQIDAIARQLAKNEIPVYRGFMDDKQWKQGGK